MTWPLQNQHQKWEAFLVWQHTVGILSVMSLILSETWLRKMSNSDGPESIKPISRRSKRCYHGIFRSSQGHWVDNRCSPVGLSAILSPGKDDRKPMSVDLSQMSKHNIPRQVKTQYSQTEKEVLAIVWAIEWLHIYLCGKWFTLYTDCKPVQLIFDNPRSARIEHWNLRFQGQGSTYKRKLSRHTTLRETPQDEEMADYVNLLCLHTVPKAMTLTELQEATKANPTCAVIRSRKWYEAKSEELKQYAKVKDELTVNAESNLILFGSTKKTY